MKAVRNTKTGPAMLFPKGIFGLFGIPERLICDRRTCFMSKKFQNYGKECGIKITFNAAATLRANGQMERYNRTILNALSCPGENKVKWDERKT